MSNVTVAERLLIQMTMAVCEGVCALLLGALSNFLFMIAPKLSQVNGNETFTLLQIIENYPIMEKADLKTIQISQCAMDKQHKCT